MKHTLKYREVRRAAGFFRIQCNLCKKMFRAGSRALRFCRTCREESELFRFSEWVLGASRRLA